MVHNGQSPFECPQCHIYFRQFQHLKKHKCDNKISHNIGLVETKMVSENKKISETNVNPESNPLYCKECRKTFLDSIKSQKHQWRHTDEMTKIYSCSQKFFLYSSDLKHHMKVHTGEKPFRCSYCAARFFGSGPLKEHMRIHTDEKPFSCIDFDYSFSDSSSFRRHNKTRPGDLVMPDPFG